MGKKTDKPKPTYWSKLPAEVRYDNNLHPGAKVLYSEIDSLQRKRGYCWASNSYFAVTFKKSINTISTWVAQLIERGHVTSRVDKSKANRRYLSTVPASTFKLMNDCSDTIPENGDSAGSDTITKNGDSLSQKTVRTIPKNGEPYNRRNKKSEVEERETPADAAPLSLDLEILKNQIPDTVWGRQLRNSLDSAHLSISSSFVAWFITEAVGRFTKSINLTVAQVKDWDKMVWEHFEGDGQLLTDALVAITVGNKDTKGHLPSIKRVRSEAGQIKKMAESRLKTAARQKQAKAKQETMDAYVPYDQRSDEDLAKIIENPATTFELTHVTGIVNKRKQESADENGIKLQAGGIR